MKAYSVLAKKYDALMRDFDYDGYFEYILPYLDGLSKGADLCSGSGELTIRLAKVGKKVIGIDISTEMLDEARSKARSCGLNIPFIEQDVSEFELMGKSDFITICCDGVNYIKDIRSLFARAYSYIKDGGVFIFDFSTEYKLRKVLGDNIFYEDYNDYTYLWTNRCDSHSIKMDITVFNKEKNGLYSREDESHRQYIHKVEDAQSMLSELGFEVSVVDGETYGKLQDKSNRALFVCKK